MLSSYLQTAHQARQHFDLSFSDSIGAYFFLEGKGEPSTDAAENVRRACLLPLDAVVKILLPAVNEGEMNLTIVPFGIAQFCILWGLNCVWTNCMQESNPLCWITCRFDFDKRH